MRTVELQISVPNRRPADVYETLADFERYPDMSEAVRSVEVTQATATTTVSRWEVSFRAGVLCWTEQDTFDRDELTIEFRQLEGDVALFDGSWRCAPSDSHAAGSDSGGTMITFAARLDMGIPSLADALEPIAVRTLIENTVSIVSGLFGDASLHASDVQTPAPVGSAS